MACSTLVQLVGRRNDSRIHSRRLSSYNIDFTPGKHVPRIDTCGAVQWPIQGGGPGGVAPPLGIPTNLKGPLLNK